MHRFHSAYFEWCLVFSGKPNKTHNFVMRMSYVILSWWENVRGNRTELVTCVKVALKHDWQLFCLQLNHLYPSSTNTFTGYSGGFWCCEMKCPPSPAQRTRMGPQLSPCCSDWLLHLLFCHSVTHRLSSSSRQATCSCSCGQQTPCH